MTSKCGMIARLALGIVILIEAEAQLPGHHFVVFALAA